VPGSDFNNEIIPYVVTYLRGWSTASASVGEQFVYWGGFLIEKNRAPRIWLKKKFKNLTLGPNPKTSEEKFRKFNDTRGLK
jgi:membrane protein DedA with SNARE-associated domain